MKKNTSLVLLFTLLFVGYASATSQSSVPAAQAAQMPTINKSALTLRTNNLFLSAQITTPELGKPIKSPLTIRGKVARSFAFEGTFPIVLKDANGKELARASAHVVGSNNTSNAVPFLAMLTFAQPISRTGTLVLQKDNPSGLPQNDDSRIFNVVFPKWTSYTNGKYNFKLQYPADFVANKNLDAKTILSLQYPSPYTVGTNLEYAKVEIKVSDKPDECSVSEFDQHILTTTMLTSNSIAFHEDIWGDSGMGHTGETISYNTVKNGNCFKIALSMYSASMSMYTDENGVPLPSPVAFDKEKVEVVFKQIISTFKFL